MGLRSKTGNMPSFRGKIVAEVPTPTYSGTSDPDDASVSINPNTGQGPGAGGAGLTTSQIEAQRAGQPEPVFTLFHDNVLLGDATLDLSIFSGDSLVPTVGVFAQQNQTMALEIATTAANQSFAPPDGFSAWESTTDGFEPTDMGALATLSNANRRISFSQAGGSNTAQYTSAKNFNTPGAFYWEVKIITKPGAGNWISEIKIGFANKRVGGITNRNVGTPGPPGFSDNDGATFSWGRNHLAATESTRLYKEDGAAGPDIKATFLGHSELGINSILGFALSW